MATPDFEKLIAVLREVRALLARPGNAFIYSSWDDTAHALREFDQLLIEVQSGHVPAETLKVLFAPTGSIQEVSVDSGWGCEFLELAAQFDDALGS